MNTNELYWVAGLLEGEGSFFLKTGRPYPIAKCEMTDFDVIDRLHALCGGQVYIHTPENPKHKPVKKWVLSGQEAALLMKKLKPLMGQRRAAKIQEVLDAYTSHLSEQIEIRGEYEDRCNEAARKYLSGQGSLRSIGKEYGISYVTVKNYADSMGALDNA